MANLVVRLGGTWLALRSQLRPHNHALKYRLYEHINEHVYKGLDFAEQKEMGHGIWDRYPEVLPCARHAPYVFETSGEPQADEDVLEIGCGLGAVAFYCAETFPQINSYTAIDLDKGNIEKAQGHNRYPDRLSFHALDATKLSTTSVTKVRERAERGFHRVYFLEVTPEISKEQFVGILGPCIQYLRPGGFLMITALTLEDQPTDKDEEQVLYMIRPDSPKLSDILEAAAQYPCEVAHKDITDISIRAFTDWTVEHLHHVDEAYTWPVTGMGKAYFRGSKAMVDRGALKQYDILVTKKAAEALS